MRIALTVALAAVIRMLPIRTNAVMTASGIRRTTRRHPTGPRPLANKVLVSEAKSRAAVENRTRIIPTTRAGSDTVMSVEPFMAEGCGDIEFPLHYEPGGSQDGLFLVKDHKCEVLCIIFGEDVARFLVDAMNAKADAINLERQVLERIKHPPKDLA